METPLRVMMPLIAILAINFLAATVTTMMTTAVTSLSQALPGCEEWCGDLRIPYPFGVREGCYLNEDFFIACNTSYNPPKAFLTGSNLNVTNISIGGELDVLQFVGFDCYNPDGFNFWSKPSLQLRKFTVSNTQNKFTAIGCDTLAFITGFLNGDPYKSGCMALCPTIHTVRNGACSGNGCCQIEIPEGLKNWELEIKSFDNHTSVMDFNPCGYAFVTRTRDFDFSSSYIRNFSENKVPIVINWGIGNDTCLNVKNKSNCICGKNSKRIGISNKGDEYHCQCLEGYEGNPYLPQGCQDIDECKDAKLHDCKYQCENTDGNYTCLCPRNYKGDGRRDGEGCNRNSKSFIQIIIGVSVGMAVLLISITWLYLGYKRYKYIKLKEKFFEKNGGLMLQQHLSKWKEPTHDMVKIFTQEELDKSTNNFNENTIVGKGGYGTVYKGVLENGQTIAIKKSKLADQSQIEQFINEVIILSQINHRNVVKLLGCCLETEVPLLVYEFIANGTLFDCIHDENNNKSHIALSWEVRLRIASETASVLSYLHSSASTPIIHRDVKSTNILLDHNYTAKVSDFGASKLVPIDQIQLSTMVQGTLGYLDPEYLLTSELTEKSDVYSFGIVLLELLTGKKAVSFDGPEVERNLALYVISAVKGDNLKQVVERGLVTTESNFEQVKQVAKLACMCLKIKGDERPSMKEVAMELEGLRLMVEHPWINNNLNNTEERYNLLGETSQTKPYHFAVNNGDGIIIVEDSMKTQARSLFHDGR